MQSGGPFGRQEYTLKHSVVQPITIIVVPLLTRVHKLSVNLFLSSCFFGARAMCWLDRWGLKFLTGSFIFICLLSDLFQLQNSALQLPCLQSVGHPGECSVKQPAFQGQLNWKLRCCLKVLFPALWGPKCSPLILIIYFPLCCKEVQRKVTSWSSISCCKRWKILLNV